MPPCPSCGAELTSEWKYCIHCGETLTASIVPGAIRVQDAEAARPRTRLDVPLLVGIVLGTAGVVVLAYTGILLFGPG